MLRDTTSRGLYVRFWPPHTSERRGGVFARVCVAKRANRSVGRYFQFRAGRVVKRVKRGSTWSQMEWTIRW